MDSRISGLHDNMTGLQADLRELQAENARISLENESFERKMEALRKINENLRQETNERVDTKGRAWDSSSAATGRAQLGPDDGISIHVEPHDKIILARFAQLLNRSSDMDALKSESLPEDIRNRAEVYVKNRECRL